MKNATHMYEGTCVMHNGERDIVSVVPLSCFDGTYTTHDDAVHAATPFASMYDITCWNLYV